MFNKVYVCCPGNVVTGGPELLHQFVSELRLQGVDAFILYTPFEQQFQVPNQYKHYDVPVADFASVDEKSSLVVLPEVCTDLIDYFKNAGIAVWWLSVDNYLGFKGEHPVKDYILHLCRLFLSKKTTIHSMKKYQHFVQCEYAREFLLKKGISSFFLTDYLNATHLELDSDVDLIKRENIIAYNPKKGKKYTQEIISANPSLTFVPIQNMSPSEVKGLLLKSKIYIDFGHHPGKDRFPREAAMAGCCIITGRRGSANNDIDIPIPSKYKLGGLGKELTDAFSIIANDILNDYTLHSTSFESYRESIMNEPKFFKEQVAFFIAELKIEK